MRQIPINIPKVIYQGKVYKHPFKGIYEVCEEGFIYSCQRKQFLVPTIDPVGHVSIQLRGKGIICKYSLGRLILEHFTGPPPDVIHYSRFDCYHKDHIRLHNNISNLEWQPRSEIILRAYRETERRRQGITPEYEDALKIYKTLPGAHKRKVKAISDEAEFIFPAILDLATYLGIYPTRFHRYVGTGKTYRGFQFEYA